jgi:uncharacterized protein
MDPVPTEPRSGSDKLWSILCHLSGFMGVPFLLPLIVYLVMRSDSEYAADQAREALNFHLSLLLYAICSVPLVFIVIGFAALWAVGIVFFVCSIVAAIKTSKGILYRYPITIRFVR